MCGIVGVVGLDRGVSVLIDGLKKLEYRGYDSAGIAVIDKENQIAVEKIAGKVKILEKKIENWQNNSKIGIAHTRWATHGEPNKSNAHPHIDCSGKIAVVHNGIIENFSALKKMLTDRGHHLTTDTDTEIIAHLIEEFYENDLFEAVRIALQEVDGTYGLAVVSALEPDRIVVARLGSPLIIGRAEEGMLIASDTVAPLRVASFIAARVSAVSPLWLIANAIVFFVITGFLYLNSLPYSTSTGIPASFSIKYSPISPA